MYKVLSRINQLIWIPKYFQILIKLGDFVKFLLIRNCFSVFQRLFFTFT